MQVTGQKLISKYLQITRREFLKAAGTFAAFCAAPFSPDICKAKRLGPRKAKPNLFTADGKPLLVSVEGTDAEKMLAVGLKLIGGLEKIVTAGGDALIKPNYGSHRIYPTGSDPHFLVSIANHLKKNKAGKVTICDSSDAYVLNRYNDHEHVFKTHNVFEIGKKAGVEVVCVHPKDEKLYVPVYSDKWKVYPEIKAIPRMLNASVVINQPMLKKHIAAHMTCALKNFFGAVYQPQRIDAHQKLKNGDRQSFMKATAEFADAIRPELNIVDARKILTVHGPSFKKKSVIKDVNTIILCGDMVATDAYCAQILDAHDETFSAGQIAETLKYAEKLGLGTANLNKVKIIEVKV
jgi:uncharacterized protein (DUF362 family)